MKITDMLVSAVLKRGILYEARNCDVELDVPMPQELADKEGKENKIKIHIKAEHVSMRIEKE